MARPEKVAAVEEIREKLTSADATVLTEYRGLTVPEIARLRESLKDAGAQYKVFKNTLARRAAEAAELSEIVEYLEGPTAFAFVEGDVVGTAKALRDFGRTNDHLVVKGGLLNGTFITAEQVEELAKLPSREELLAKIAGGFKAPMQKAAGLFSAIQRNMAYGLKALIDKRVEGGEEAPPEASADSEDIVNAGQEGTEANADQEGTEANADQEGTEASAGQEGTEANADSEDTAGADQESTEASAEESEATEAPAAETPAAETGPDVESGTDESAPAPNTETGGESSESAPAPHTEDAEAAPEAEAEAPAGGTETESE